MATAKWLARATPDKTPQTPCLKIVHRSFCRYGRNHGSSHSHKSWLRTTLILPVFLVVLSVSSLWLQKVLLDRYYLQQPHGPSEQALGHPDTTSPLVPVGAPWSSRNKTHVGTLQTPILVLSLPKSGTTTTQKFFNCGQMQQQPLRQSSDHRSAGGRKVLSMLRANHHWSRLNDQRQTLIRTGQCFAENVAMNRPMLQGCGDYQVWTDTGAVYAGARTNTNRTNNNNSNDSETNHWRKENCFFPSIHGGLPNIARYYPQATIIMVIRNPSHWFHSVLKWGKGALAREWQVLCRDFPTTHSAYGEWIDFYNNHTRYVRNFAQQHHLKYLEVHLDDPQTIWELHRQTGIPLTCWQNCRPDGGCRNITIPSEKGLLLSTDDADSSTTTAQNSIHTDYNKIDEKSSIQAPVMILSLPKSGTTFLRKYLDCGDRPTTSHLFASFSGEYFLQCFANNIATNMPMLRNCGEFDIWTDLGGILMHSQTCFYPAWHALDNIGTHYPNATIVLSVWSNATRWYEIIHSQARELMRKWRSVCTTFPNETISNQEVWTKFYDDYTDRIRRFKQRHPSIHYVELLLDSPNLGSQLERIMGIPSSCWPAVPKQRITSSRRDTGLDTSLEERRIFVMESAGSPNIKESPGQENSAKTRNSYGRNQLPTPVLVLSLPKSGTTSMQKYFNCAERKTGSHHWSILEDGRLVRHAACLGKNVAEGRPMLEGCGNFIAWSDMGSIYDTKKMADGDDDHDHDTTTQCFFPSLHGLNNIATHYPNASLILVVRDAGAWYRSLRQWSGGKLMRSMARYCPGFPKDPSRRNRADWIRFYQNHTNSIRSFAKQNPSITYVEVPLEGSNTGIVLQDKVGISSDCWRNCKPQERNHRCTNVTTENGR